MAHLLTLLSDAWRVVRSRLQKQDSVATRLRLDRSGPGSHLVWDIANVGTDPITVTSLVVHSRTGPNTVRLGMAQVLNSQEHTLLPTDVDWTLLSATSMAVCDAAGGEHPVPRKQLQLIQEQLGTLTEHRVYAATAKDWLNGATDLAVGMVILGLGFFMLMWVIATG
jgi:hypothetical protein